MTRHGHAVAELRPLRRAAVPADVLKRRWANLPAVDVEAFRRDVDRVLDVSL